MRSTQLFLLPMVLFILLSGHIQFFSLSLYPSYWCCWDIYCFSLSLCPDHLYCWDIYNFSLLLCPSFFSVGIFQLSFAHMSHSLCLMGFHSYLFVHMCHSLCLMGFYSCFFAYVPPVHTIRFITGNNNFPCMFHLLFGRRLHIFQCIRIPSSFHLNTPSV